MVLITCEQELIAQSITVIQYILPLCQRLYCLLHSNIY